MSSAPDTRFFGHPRGLSTLFFTELWERFGYYGMRALLILFMTASVESGGLGIADSKAYGIYGLYIATVYLLSLPGGWLADRVLGQQRTVLYGGILIAAGYLMLAVPSQGVFFAGLAVVAIGTGLLKPNISTIVGQIYSPEDRRRDSGFSIFYMGINLGALLAPLVCGPIGTGINWQLGFGLAGVGMVVGVFTFAAGRKHLGDAGLHPAPVASAGEAKQIREQLRNGLLAFTAAPLLLAAVHFSGVYPLTIERLVDGAGFVLLLAVIVLFAWMFLGAEWTPEERKRLYVIAVLFFASSLFWSAFEQAGSSLNIFAARFTDNTLFGVSVSATVYQSLNPIYIIALAPVFAWLWIRLGHRQPSSPAKFSLGLISVGLGFVLMMIAAMEAGTAGRVSPLWLAGCYLLHTTGELCLSPVGLSAFTKLAPARVAGLMMGVWFLSISTGNYLGGRLAAFYGELPIQDLFQTTATFAIVAGLILALVARPVARLMGALR
ncbi:MAG: peptide MFS transporter [Bryobacteraceae bacterium]|nr:peptide MFS transporter [Bryobacteraceae bacterium]